MSQPRIMERKTRQRRKAKLAALRVKFLSAKTQDAKERILEKAESVSPNLEKSQYATAWAK